MRLACRWATRATSRRHACRCCSSCCYARPCCSVRRGKQRRRGATQGTQRRAAAGEAVHERMRRDAASLMLAWLLCRSCCRLLCSPGHVFFLSFQTYVMRLDQIVNAVALVFVCAEVLLA